MTPRVLKPFLAMAAASLAMQSAFAQTTPAPNCITPRDAQALISFALPEVINGVAAKCAPLNGPSSFLAASGKTLAERYRPASEAAWPLAKPVIRQLAGAQAGLIDLLPDESLKSFSASFAATGVVREIKPERCGDIDRVMRVVAPLPPENMSMLVGIMLEILSRPTAQAAIASRKMPLNLCPAPTGAGQNVTTK